MIILEKCVKFFTHFFCFGIFIYTKNNVMELGQFAIIKTLLTEIRDLLKEQQPAQTRGLLLDSVQRFSSDIDENRCSCGNLPNELCAKPDCIRQIGIKNNLL